MQRILLETKVCIILVNYNTYSETIECVESLFNSKYKNFQIFIIDNSTGNQSENNFYNWLAGGNDKIPTNFPNLVYPLTKKPIAHKVLDETDFLSGIHEEQLLLIKADNRGFAAANNIVLKYLIKYDIKCLVWVLNNDTVVENDTLTNLVNYYIDSDDKKIIIGAVLKHYFFPARIQAIAGRYNMLIGKHYHIGNGELTIEKYRNYVPQENDYVVGASMFFNINFVNAVGLMCEDYFLYFEEMDWMMAGYKHGYKMAVAQNAVVYHKEGASIIPKGRKKDTSVAEYYSIINRVKFIKKWHPGNLPTILIFTGFAILKRILKGKFALAGKSFTEILKIVFNK